MPTWISCGTCSNRGVKTLVTDDGIALHWRQWPTPEASRGAVLIVHGLGEHIERYAALAAHLTGQGWQVAGYDLRGHGRSGGPRGGIAQADSLLADLGRAVERLRAGAPQRLVLLGHSLGGLLAARFVAEGLAASPAPWFREVDALVLSSPALDPGMNAVQKLMLAVAAPLVPELALSNGLTPAWISRDAAVVKAYVDDPLVHDRVTPRLVRFIVDAGREVLAAAPRWRLPTLLMWAGADRCVAPRGSEAFAAAAPAAVLQHQAWPGLFHEILNEPERDAVLARLTAWLSAQLSAQFGAA